MDRREFVKFLALTAASAAATPTQLAAFDRYYEANTPRVATGIIAVDEIFIGGTAARSMRLHWQFWGGGKCVSNFAMNGFGGMIRWVPTLKQEIITSAKDFSWTVTALGESDDFDPHSVFQGHISYIDQDAVRHTHLLPGDGRSIVGV